MRDLTVIYLTDDTPIREDVLHLCNHHLLASCNNLPLITISQSEHVLFGHNIRLGKIGRSWWSLYSQLLTGLEHVATRFVAIAERDMLYTHTHFHRTPPTPDTFYHNTNMWILQWSPLENSPHYTGMFSYRRDRFSLANLLCSRDILLQQTQERMAAIRSSRHAYRLATQDRKAVHLSAYFTTVTDRPFKPFNTSTPIIDVRHETNFSGVRRGNLRRASLHPWGTLEDIKRCLTT